MKKLLNSKIAKGLVSLITIIVLLISILATSLFYENNITGFVVSETISDEETSMQIKIVDDIKELNKLNEGWYQVKNGYVYYLETFDLLVPLYIKVNNPEQKNGLLLVEKDGTIMFDKKFDGLVEDDIDEKSLQNKITGQVTGMESVSGFATQSLPGSTTFADIKVGDILNGKKVVKVESIGATVQITVEGGAVYSSSSATRIDLINDQQAKIVFGDPLRVDREILAATSTGSTPPTKTPIVEQEKELDNEINTLEKNLPTDLKERNLQLEVVKLKRIKLDSLQSAKYELIPQLDKSIKELETELTLIRSPTDGLIKFSFNPNYEYPNLVQKILNERIQKGDLETFNQIASTPQGKEILFAAAQNQKVKDYIEQYNLKEGFQLYLQRKTQCPGICEYNSNSKTYKNQQNQEFQLLAAADGTYRYVSITKETPATGVIADKTGIAKQTMLNKISKMQDMASYNVIEADGYFVLINKNTGKIYGITSDPQGNLAVSSEIITGPKEITFQDKKFTKFEGYAFNAQQIYKDSKGNVFSQQNLLSPVKGETITFTEKVGEEGLTFELQKSLKTDSNGKLTLDVARTQIILDGKPYDIDTDTYNKIKAAKDIEKPTVVGTKVTIKIVDTVITFVGYSLEKKGPSGTKITEQFRTIFLDKEGNEISAKEAKELEEKGEAPEQKQVHAFWQEEVLEGGRRKFLTIYGITVEKGFEVYEAAESDETGKIIEFTYGKKDLLTEVDQYIVLEPGAKSPFGLFTSCKIKNPVNPHLEAEGCARLKQYASRQFFAEVERIFTEFRGLGYYATLFFDDDSLLKWRDSIDEKFATLYLGTEYWSSEICGQYLDGENEGIAYAETPQGLAQIGAHIEATRTEPIATPTGREFIYKITFNVRNGDYDKDPRAPEEMNINVVLKGERTVKVFKTNIEIKRGSTFGKTGSKAIVQESNDFFNEVCLVFDKIPLRWKIDNKELCNVIQETTSVPTPLIESTATATTSEKTQVEEINDF